MSGVFMDGGGHDSLGHGADGIDHGGHDQASHGVQHGNGQGGHSFLAQILGLDQQDHAHLAHHGGEGAEGQAPSQTPAWNSALALGRRRPMMWSPQAWTSSSREGKGADSAAGGRSSARIQTSCRLGGGRLTGGGAPAQARHCNTAPAGGFGAADDGGLLLQERQQPLGPAGRMGAIDPRNGGVGWTGRFQQGGLRQQGRLKGQPQRIDILYLAGRERRGEDVEAVGTRHRAAYRFVNDHLGALAIVVSHDGGVSFVANREGRVVFWEQSVSP